MAAGWGRRTRVDLFQRNVSGNTSTTAPTAWYGSLHTGNPGDDGQTSNEVTITTSGYGRYLMTGGTKWNITAYGSVTVDTACTVTNAATLSFGPSSGANAAWGTITYVGIWEHVTTATEAVYLGRAAASVSQSVGGTGVTITIAIGALSMSVTSS
jgi:hypothetical protein